jgi:hypothetical protein
MKGLWGSLTGALALGGLTAYYHASLPPETAGEIIWGIVLLQAAPAGALVGLMSELALRAPLGGRRALCCFSGSFLALVPPGIWAWLAVSGDPFHALPKLWATLVLCLPTLVASVLLTVWGLVSLRPGRFRTKESQE